MSILSHRSDALSAPFVLVSSDGRMFPVDEVSAMKSGYLKYLIKARLFGKINTEVPGHVLEKIVYFIMKKYEEPTTENLKDFESEFLQQNQRLLLDLVEAAFYLHVYTLVDLVRKAVLDRIAEKTREEFREIFNLSPQEMEEMQKYGVWDLKPSCTIPKGGKRNKKKGKHQAPVV